MNFSDSVQKSLPCNGLDNEKGNYIIRNILTMQQLDKKKSNTKKKIT